MATPTHPHWRNDATVLNASRNNPAFKLNASGSGVQRLREALLAIGAPAIDEPPASFGPLTLAQLKVFQGLYGLAADGAAGAGTIGKLDQLLFAAQARKPWPKAAAAAGDNEAFLQQVAAACAATVRAAGLPVSAMLACAAVESGWGNGAIYRETGNLFSLQKWPWVVYPMTARTLWRDTVIQTIPRKTAKAPFNTATDLADAGRQWCEWIANYGGVHGPPGSIDRNRPQRADNPGAVARRLRLINMAGDPLLFARNLYLVGFGESLAHGELYARVLSEHRLTRFD
jgi:peptidoglycan hydrolase-like protein with peptidoglycan-binding domain